MNELQQILLVSAVIAIAVCGIMLNRHIDRKAELKARTDMIMDRNSDEGMRHRPKGQDEPPNYLRI